LQGSFKAHSTDINGNPLASLGKISVTRGDKTGVVAEFASATPGATLQFTDNDIPQRGNYTYYVNCSDSDGNAGREASASVYVGPAIPANVPAVYMVEGSTPGTVILSWKAPATDIDGIDLNPANLSYMIYVAGEYGSAKPVIDEPTTELQAEFTVCAPGEKAFATFYVEALNLGLESKGLTRSPMIPVGKPDALPFRHSFNSADRADHLLGYEVPDGSGATVTVSNMAESGVQAVDSDDAFLKLNNSTQYAIVNFFTGKIALGSAANPAVSFYHYKWSDSDTNSFDVMVFDSEGNGAMLGSCDHATDGNVGWNFAQFPITGFTGKEVYVYIAANFKSHQDQLFDVLTVADRHNIDLVAAGLAAPARVEADKEFTLTASVANSGLQTVADYSVDLLLNGTVIATGKGNELAPGAQTAVTFRHTLSPLTDGALEFTARVNVAGDGNEADNLSQPAAPQLVVSKFPAVTDLTASRVDSGVELSWSAPSTAGFDVKETEDFEDATAWTEEVEGWTMIDRDGQQIGTLEGAGLPDAVGMRTSHSFFVFDNESDDILFYNPDLAFLCGANSGSKSLVAMYILNSTVSQDDWAISPLLSGEAQTLSFYARSFHPEYPDHMEVLYSEKDSTDPDDFTTLCPDGAFEVPQLVDAIGNAAYKYYEFELPAGARRFALRAINPGGDGFMLMIDDVKFRQANATLAVDSYDVYRDGVKVNGSPVTQTSYLDVPADEQPHSYNVVVNYNRGLSPASNTVSVEALSVGNTLAESTQVSVCQRDIIVRGPAGAPVRLYAVDGRELCRAKADCSIGVPPGSYIITVGSRSFKVVVK
ncbi:MAG: choice-of-anchor J domain-containing protein, partial [Muribaculaceae bacterium]|nr:choice-of-anchor J domain-containing protein [Muribaculaceae bacterium]